METGKKAAVMLTLLALLAGNGIADTQIGVSIFAKGTTDFTQTVEAGGVNWQKTGDDDVSGSWYIDSPGNIIDYSSTQSLSNTGFVSMNNNLIVPTYADGSKWDVLQTIGVTASGDTTLGRYVNFRTNTRAVGADGFLAYPTVMEISTIFQTGNQYTSTYFGSTANIDTEWYGYNYNLNHVGSFNFGEDVVKNPDVFAP